MHPIVLRRGTWQYDTDDPLGTPGGFGAVYRGVSSSGEPFAIKRLHFSAKKSGARELRVADALIDRSLLHVMPYIDLGLDDASDAYFLVMPIAEMSLADHISRAGVLTEDEAIRILISIAEGLGEVGDLVHRDLKPSNVLLHDGEWKIADFGIARFVEESTSLETLKGCLSPPYAAPEQWTFQRPTHATDIYSLGVTAYQLLTSQLPFPGPSQEDYREQHLQSSPPSLSSTDPRLTSTIMAMLRKAPQARPSSERVLELLRGIEAASAANVVGRPGFSALAQAGGVDLERALATEAAAALAQASLQQRQHLAEEATRSLLEIASHFRDVVQQAAVSARVSRRHEILLQVDLGTATLELAFLPGLATPYPENAFPRSKWDVIAGATIAVKQTQPSEYVWSGNLWYTDLGLSAGYRWWEALYMTHPLVRSSPRYQPFAVLELEEADAASGPGMDRLQLAARPKPIDAEGLEEFCDRWAAKLAEAFNGQLQHPSHLPLD